MKPKHQRGAQAVEFALVLPFFLAILLLVMDFGFLVYNKAVITNAAREAARAGSMGTTSWSSATVAAVACNYARSALTTTDSTTPAPTNCPGVPSPTSCAGMPSLAVTVTPGGTLSPAFGEPVSVTVAYAYPGLLRSMINPARGSAPTSTTTDWATTGSLCAVSRMNFEGEPQTP
jgi:Flp pilus assembly protein TadG